MINKLFKTAAHGINIAVLCAMVGVGAFHWDAAQAQQRMNRFTPEQMHCLQQNIYFEARNQSTLGQVAVAWVTLNRMDHERYPDTICEVVWQPRQFSWTHDGKSDEPGTNAIEQQAWHDAGLVAQAVVIDWATNQESPVDNATMFHAHYVSPYWSEDYAYVTQVETHIFYE